MIPRTIMLALAWVAVLGLGCASDREPPKEGPALEGPDQPAPAAAHADDWCAGHGLPESKCTKCNPELIPAFEAAGDWCEAHGFPESACPRCNPQRPRSDAAAAADWCVEHALPESMCTRCNPDLVAEYRAAGDYCDEHGFPESVCPACNPQEPPPGAERAAIEARVVRFRTPQLERQAGVQTQAAARGRATTQVECTASIAFDADRIGEVRAIVPGIVRRIHAELGADVERGEALFVLESTQVGEIQGALQIARERVRAAEANLARKRELRDGDIASARQVELAEQELASAKAEVRTAAAALRMAGAAGSKPSGRYSLTAPIAGTVVRRPAVRGALASHSEALATIADTSVMWALCDVPERDAAAVSVGQPMAVSLNDDGPSLEGEVTWIAAEVDPRTRTVVTRASLPNPEGRLRANQFARARIETAASRDATLVPREAVQRVGTREVVFVRTAPGVYEPRVVTRHGDGEDVRVEGRVAPGDPVVTTGAVLLRTEVMPDSIGAGCCEVAPPGGE